MKNMHLICLVVALVTTGCIIDNLAVTTGLDEDFEVPPNAPETIIRGAVDENLRGGTLALWNASGGVVTPLQASLRDDGGYDVRFAGTESFTAMRITVVKGSRVGMVLVQEVPRALSVNSPPTVLDMSRYLPAMAVMNDETTATTLLLEYKARTERGGMGTLSPDEIETAVAEIDGRIFDDGPVLSLRQAVTRLLDAADAAGPGTPAVFVMPDQLAAVGTSLNPEFLSAVSVDYDLDGAPDSTTDKFDALLAAAAETFELAPPCFDPELIRVVWQLDFNEGIQDDNCEVIDRFKWVLPDPGDQVFIAGAVHPDHPSCEDEPGNPVCTTPQDVAQTGELLGSFSPNVAQLFDDGTNGDAVAGDGIYTLSLQLKRGLRLHYKYTYGRGGQGWTGTEEWPGNSRLLELVDENGDGIVTRYDRFADETANKDKANQLSPARGGRGTIDFMTDANGDGVADAHENRIDTDGDCVPDAWPSPGPVAPVLADPEVCME